MKKLYIILLLIGAVYLGHAQISNSGFESWTETAGYDHPDLAPADFTSTNTEAFFETGIAGCTEIMGNGGGSAMRLETYEFEGDIVQGWGITGVPPEGEELIFSGGFPFSDMNVGGISVDLKYDIGILSPGFIIVQFLADGTPVTGGPEDNGTYLFPLFGYQGSWTTMNYTFTSPLTQVPDECIVGFACNDVINETGNVGDYIEVDNFSFTGTDEVFPGGDFDTWIEEGSYLIPDDWESFLPPNYGFYSQSMDAYEGDYSIELTNIAFEDTVQGMIYQGELNDFGFFPDVVLEAEAEFLEFYYTYEAANPADSATVYLLLSEVENPLPEDVAFSIHHLGPQTDWTMHSIDLATIMPNANYYGLLFSSGYGFDEISYPGSTLKLDAVNFVTGDCEYVPTIVEGDITMCPGDDIALTTQMYDSYTWYASIAGEGDFEEAGTADTLDLSEAEPGMYDIYVLVSLDGCEESSESILLDIYEPVQPVIVYEGEYEQIDICAGETVAIEVENADEFDNFQWTLLGFDIPGADESIYESTGILDLGSTFNVVVTVDQCPDLEMTSEGFTVQSHSNPFPVITQDGNTLNTPDLYDDYQWFLDGAPIDGATSASLDAEEDGEYTVVAFNEWDCEGTSFPFDFIYVGLEELANLEMKLFPNPASTQVVLTLAGNNGKVIIELYDLVGNLAMTNTVLNQHEIKLDISELPTGNYFVKVQCQDEVVTKRLIVKQ